MGEKVAMDVAQRRARLGRRQRLAASAHANPPVEVVRSLVALHATDPASVFLSAAVRMQEPSIAAIEAALYSERLLIRMLGMRRTMFVVADEMAPVIHAACTTALAVQLRRRYTQVLERAAVADDVPAWLARVETATVDALQKRGEATAQQLGEDVPELKTQVRLAEGKNYESTRSISTWVLMLLSAQGRIIRGRPRGSWISSQYRWTPIENWLPGGLAAMPTHAAQVVLVRAWLRAFGPGALGDIKWWTGLTMAEIKRAIAEIDVLEVDLGEARGVVLEDDVELVAPPEPWTALLPALDPTPMGYTERSWFLGNHGAFLFDRSGNIGPSVWCDGRVVGGWAQRPDGVIVYRLLEDIGREAEQRVEAGAAALGGWLAGVRITPRFRTPLERELLG